MKAYWMTVGAGALLAVVGGILWVTSDNRYGLIITLSGLVIAVLGLVIMLIQWGMDKSK